MEAVLATLQRVRTAQRVREKMEELKKSFPEDIDYVVSLEMTPFIEKEIKRWGDVIERAKLEKQ